MPSETNITKTVLMQNMTLTLSNYINDRPFPIKVLSLNWLLNLSYNLPYFTCVNLINTLFNDVKEHIISNKIIDGYNVLNVFESFYYYNTLYGSVNLSNISERSFLDHFYNYISDKILIINPDLEEYKLFDVKKFFKMIKYITLLGKEFYPNYDVTLKFYEFIKHCFENKNAENTKFKNLNLPENETLYLFKFINEGDHTFKIFSRDKNLIEEIIKYLMGRIYSYEISEHRHLLDCFKIVTDKILGHHYYSKNLLPVILKECKKNYKGNDSITDLLKILIKVSYFSGKIINMDLITNISESFFELIQNTKTNNLNKIINFFETFIKEQEVFYQLPQLQNQIIARFISLIELYHNLTFQHPIGQYLLFILLNEINTESKLLDPRIIKQINYLKEVYLYNSKTFRKDLIFFLKSYISSGGYLTNNTCQEFVYVIDNIFIEKKSLIKEENYIRFVYTLARKYKDKINTQIIRDMIVLIDKFYSGDTSFEANLRIIQLFIEHGVYSKKVVFKFAEQVDRLYQGKNKVIEGNNYDYIDINKFSKEEIDQIMSAITSKGWVVN